MKFIYPLLLLSILFTACSDEPGTGNNSSAPTTQQADTIKGTPGTFYDRYSGMAGNQRIVLNLVKYKHTLAVSYYKVSDNRPVMLMAVADSTAPADEFILKEGRNAEITWHLKQANGKLTGEVTNASNNKEPVNLSVDYPEGSYKLVTYCYDGAGRLLEHYEQPQATAAYGMVWPAGSWDAEHAAFAHSRISIGMDLEGGNGVEEGLKTRAKRYFAGYRNELRSVVDSNWPEMKRKDVAYHYTTTFYHHVIYNDQSWLVLKNAMTSYTGGAHGMYSSRFQNMDMKSERDWDINQVLNDTVALKPYLELAARDYFGVQSTEDISSRLLVTEIPATSNFYVTPSGLTFVYNPYEIASYADGEIQLFIPYEKLMNLLTRDFKERMNFTPSTGTALNRLRESRINTAQHLSFNQL